MSPKNAGVTNVPFPPEAAIHQNIYNDFGETHIPWL
jgi:hypothetical protein